jgi:hypothetical protein
VNPPLCLCQDGYFETSNSLNNSEGLFCRPCQLKCATCLEREDNCVKCLENSFRKENPPLCSCIEGNYEISKYN